MARPRSCPAWTWRLWRKHRAGSVGSRGGRGLQGLGPLRSCRSEPPGELTTQALQPADAPGSYQLLPFLVNQDGPGGPITTSGCGVLGPSGTEPTLHGA